MRRSIRWPPVLSGGRLLMTPDPDDAPDGQTDRSMALSQLIAIGLQDCTSGNPFNADDDLGVGPAVFAASTQGEEARLRARIRGMFARLERTHRARLVGIDVERDGVDTLISLTYEDLESGSRQNMEASING